MLLGNFIKNINRKYYKTYFSGVAFNSKQVEKNNIFFAIEGTKFDGNKYIFDAINNGATGGKLLGAGGGGFFLFYVPFSKQKKIIKYFNNLITIPFNFTNEGSKILFKNI